MKKIYYKTTGQEPDINCTQPCEHFKNNMVGSVSCQNCKYCKEINFNDDFVVCSKDDKEEKFDWLKATLISNLIFSFISSILYTFSNDERWFSRFALGLICVGFLYLKSNNKE